MSDIAPPVDRADFGVFDHDADIGIVGRGATVEAAFVAGAAALFDLRCPVDAVAPRVRFDLELVEDDVELAFIGWLNGLLARAHERNLALGRFALARDGSRWTGSAWGEPWRDALPRGVDVKGATLTMLAVRARAASEGGGWEARCVVDV